MKFIQLTKEGIWSMYTNLKQICWIKLAIKILWFLRNNCTVFFYGLVTPCKNCFHLEKIWLLSYNVSIGFTVCFDKYVCTVIQVY